MRTPVAITAVALAAAAIFAAPAGAAPIDKGHFDDTFDSDPYFCQFTDDPADGGVNAVDHVHVTGNFIFNQRGGRNVFPYYRESVKVTVVTTNLDTGGTYTQIAGNNNTDHKIVDNGDGTITITVRAAGPARYYDQFGKFVLKDPGAFWWSVDIDYNGTPGNPDDDVEVPDSFRVVKASTGNSDLSDRNFCEDLFTYTS